MQRHSNEYIKAKKRLLKIKEDVQFFLQTIPETRNDDRLLTAYIWKKYVPSEIICIQDIARLPTQESIKRMRAKYQEQGLYPPTSDVVKAKRLSHAGVVRDVLRGF